MKRVISLSLIILAIFNFVACSSKSNIKNVKVNDIVEEVKGVIIEDLKEVGIPEESFELEEMPGYLTLDLAKEEDRQMFNMFNQEDFESGVIIQPMMNINSDLIIILKAKDNNKVDLLKKSLEEVKESQVNTWSQYLPDQYEKVKNNIIKVEGQYLIYITYTDADKIEDIFTSSLK